MATFYKYNYKNPNVLYCFVFGLLVVGVLSKEIQPVNKRDNFWSGAQVQISLLLCPKRRDSVTDYLNLTGGGHSLQKHSGEKKI